ncbi:MAG: hypothetical protein MUC50_07160 [Myxococcota bacterium]|jgi:hypothetical protein|nr:hypothetical protein [Myxococcota bacterium]
MNTLRKPMDISAVKVRMVPAHKADAPTIKRLQERCESEGIATGVAPCPGGG